MATSRAAATEAGLEYLVALGLVAEELTPEPVVAAAWLTSMHVLTVATIKRATGDGLPLGVASALGLRRSLGSATRRMLDAERDVVRQGSIDHRGWRRVGVGLVDCDFCDMLISRGTVYTDETVKFDSHDHCDCLVEPAGVKSAGRTETSARYKKKGGS